MAFKTNRKKKLITSLARCIVCFLSFVCSHLFTQAAEIDFAHEIAPILKAHCVECHAGEKKSGGFSLNTREELLAGSERGKVVSAGEPQKSRLIHVLKTEDEDERMPAEAPALPPAVIAKLEHWVEMGLPWEPGFAFVRPAYQPPLNPRRPELPAAVSGRNHPIDRILDQSLAQNGEPTPALCDDATFARRTSMDLIGLLPDPNKLASFLADRSDDKRSRWIDDLLSDDVAYAEHWLTFWNDLLRNDYGGTGFITSGRKQISQWLYAALVENKPYDALARELIAPANADSRGFIDGIRWRGEVSAGQTVEIQFAQSVGQSFLGINMKCASCHDSFIDRWKLEDAYGLAAIYSEKPLEIHRCDKPIGKTAQASWLFPELGQIEAEAPPAKRLAQLAALMTHPENGRFSRTIVNRLWQRMMGRGIVHPLDSMESEPWNADLLDFLAVEFTDQHYDLKACLKFIANSQAYQSEPEVVQETNEGASYTYAGPRAKRLTAEQFVDAVWQLTGTSPNKFDAPIRRGKRAQSAPEEYQLLSKWIWGESARPGPPPAGETLRFHHTFELPEVPIVAGAALTCDNEYWLYINGQEVGIDNDWNSLEVYSITKWLRKGKNTIDVIGKNAGQGPNAAGLMFEARVKLAGDTMMNVISDKSWRYQSSEVVPKKSKLPEWNEAAGQEPLEVSPLAVWQDAAMSQGPTLLQQIIAGESRMVRASLLKSDFLMRSLGRPNRDQIVSSRPMELSTLEAIDLANGATLAGWLREGAQRLHDEGMRDTTDVLNHVMRFALSRPATSSELKMAREHIGDTLDASTIEDVLWSVVMLPEFQVIR